MKFFAALLLVLGLALHQSQGALYTPEQMKGFQETCAKVLQVGPDAKEWISKNDFNHPELHCFGRCAGILTKFWDDETGLQWDVISQQMADKPGLEEHKAATLACVAALNPEDSHCNCKKAFDHFMCGMKAFGQVKQ